MHIKLTSLTCREQIFLHTEKSVKFFPHSIYVSNKQFTSWKLFFRVIFCGGSSNRKGLRPANNYQLKVLPRKRHQRCLIFPFTGSRGWGSQLCSRLVGWWSEAYTNRSYRHRRAVFDQDVAAAMEHIYTNQRVSAILLVWILESSLRPRLLFWRKCCRMVAVTPATIKTE